jgi:hypothetical protein
MLSIFRIVATLVFGVLTFIVLALLTANIRKLASEHGWDNALVRCWDSLPQRWRSELRWERLQRLWWLWCIFGLSGGVALALWVTPFLSPSIAEPQVVATNLRLQFFGGTRLPQVIPPSDNIADWNAYCSPSASIDEYDAQHHFVGNTLQIPPACAVFIVFAVPTKYRNIVANFSNPDAVTLQIPHKTDRAVLITTTGRMPAGVLEVTTVQ